MAICLKGSTKVRQHPAHTRQALQWPDEEPREPEPVSEELRELRRQFWSKFAPPIYNTRVVNYPSAAPDGGLSWD